MTRLDEHLLNLDSGLSNGLGHYSLALHVCIYYKKRGTEQWETLECELKTTVKAFTNQSQTKTSDFVLTRPEKKKKIRFTWW